MFLYFFPKQSRNNVIVFLVDKYTKIIVMESINITEDQKITDVNEDSLTLPLTVNSSQKAQLYKTDSQSSAYKRYKLFSFIFQILKRSDGF